jgi:biopolymer transport protein ExbB
MSFNFLLQIQTVPTADATDISVWNLIMNSSMIINLSMLAIFGYAVFIFSERYMELRRASRQEPDFLEKIKGYLNDGNIDAAKKYCSNSDGPCARILEKGVDRLGKPLEQISTAIDNTSRVEASRLKKRIHFLPIAAAVAPMLGLLGTVTGLIWVFPSEEDGKDLKIMSALITSAEGLLIGVIALLAYFYLKTRIKKIKHSMDAITVEFMDLLH